MPNTEMKKIFFPGLYLSWGHILYNIALHKLIANELAI